MKIRIAVVEDNQTNIDLIRYQLDAAGFDIFVEKTGKKGIKMIKEKEPDLVLLDIGLPDIDGFELCKVLRSDVKTKNYPIIMLTARIEVNDRPNDHCEILSLIQITHPKRICKISYDFF